MGLFRAKNSGRILMIVEKFIITVFSNDGVWIQKEIDSIDEFVEQRAMENGFVEITEIVSEHQ